MGEKRDVRMEVEMEGGGDGGREGWRERWMKERRDEEMEGGIFSDVPSFVMAGTSTTLSGAPLAFSPHGHAIDARLFSASFNEIFDTLFRN